MKDVFLKHLSNENLEMSFVPGSLADTYSGTYAYAGYDSERFGKTLGSKIAKTLVFFKNKVMPLKMSIVEAIEAKLTFETEDLKYINIETKEIPVGTEAFLQEVKDRFVELRYYVDRFKLSFPGDNMFIIDLDVLTEEDLRAYFKTGVSEMDYIVDQVLMKKSRDDLITLFKEKLLNVSGNYLERKAYDRMFLDGVKAIEDIILTIAFFAKATKEKPRTNLDTEKSNMFLHTFLHGVLLPKAWDVLAKYGRQKEDKVLTLPSNTYKDNTLYVNGDVYKEFLEENQEDPNVIDTLLGLYVFNSKNEHSARLTVVKDILAEKEKLVKTYFNFVQAMSIRIHEQKMSNLRKYYLSSIEEQLTNIDPEDIEKHNDVPYTQQDVNDEKHPVVAHCLRQIEEHLKTMKDVDLKNIDNTVTEIVGTIIFSNDFFTQFAEELAKVKEIYGDITIQQACYIATVNLMVDYIGRGVEFGTVRNQ